MNGRLAMYRPHEIEGWMDFDELDFLFDVAAGCHTVVEIGCFQGRSTVAIMAGLRQRGGFGNLFVVDLFDGRGTSRSNEFGRGELRSRFYSNLMERGLSPFDIIAADSGDRKTASVFADKSVDLIFVDGSHDYESVKRDLDVWAPKVSVGGIICGHDYHPGTPGVVRAVDERGWKLVKGLPGSIWGTVLR